jgi:AraC-like DNA-binding protein
VSGSRYAQTGNARPAQLEAHATQQLLTALAPAQPAIKAIPQITHRADFDLVRDQVAQAFIQLGYRQNKAWLNGRCIHPENHSHGDTSPSFGFNMASGVGYCFKCGSFGLAECAEAVAVPARSIHTGPIVDTPFSFNAEHNQQPAFEPAGEQWASELNIATALFRRKLYRAARLLDILNSHSRANDGQHTYGMDTLLDLASQLGLSRTQITKALSQLTHLGILQRVGRGTYRRVSIDRIRAILKLGTDYALVSMAREAVADLNRYKKAVLMAIEQLLPKGTASARIAAAAGFSRRSLYSMENELGIQRETRTRRVNAATAASSFVKVFDAANKFVATLDGSNSFAAIELAARVGGKPWGWQQLPSVRSFLNG